MRLTKHLGSLFFIVLSVVFILVFFEINSPLHFWLASIFIAIMTIGLLIPNSYKHIQRLIVGILETIWIFFDF